MINKIDCNRAGDGSAIAAFIISSTVFDSVFKCFSKKERTVAVGYPSRQAQKRIRRIVSEFWIGARSSGCF